MALQTETSAAASFPPVVLSRFIKARREAVFEAWTDAEHVRVWFPPAPYTGPQARIEPRAGGVFEVLMRSPAGEHHWTRGHFTEVVPNSRLVIDMVAEGADGRVLFHALTEVSFADDVCGTRVDVRQRYTVLEPEIAAPMIGGAEAGWGISLDQMTAEALRMDSGTADKTQPTVHGMFRIERRYPAAPERVWRAFTEEAAKQAWFGGAAGEFERIERHLDVREGGSERLVGRWPDGTVSSFDAVYHDVVPQRRLVYSYVMHINGRKISVSLATVELETDDAGTRLSVVEQGAFLDGYDDVGSREHGTGMLLDRLGVCLGQ
jgi:uncharacterized protein YndB with AHSA1/START domain